MLESQSVDDAVRRIQEDAATRDATETADALAVEGEVVGACLAALSRLHVSQRPAVVEYLSARCKGTDYLSLSVMIVNDMGERIKRAEAERDAARRAAAECEKRAAVSPEERNADD